MNPEEEEMDANKSAPYNDDTMMEDDNLEATAVDEEEAPAFLNEQDGIEVHVDDDAPVDEDDDDEAMQEEEQIEEQEEMSALQFEAHAGPVYAVEGILQNNELLCILSGGGDDKTYFHSTTISSDNDDTATSVLLEDHPYTDSVSSVATCSNWMAVGSYDGTIVLYENTAASSRPKFHQKLDGPTDIEWLSFHPTGTVLLAGSTDGTVWMYHVSAASCQCLQVFVGHEASVTAGRFVHQGKVAVTASSDGTVRVWAPKTGLVKHVFRVSDAGITCMASSSSQEAANDTVVVGCEDGFAYGCHVKSKKIVHRLQHAEAPSTTMAQDDDEEAAAISVEAVGFCESQPHWCATAGVDGILKIWDLHTGQCRHVCRADNEDEGLTRLSWYKTFVITASTMGTVRVWDARSGVLVHTMTTRSSAVINDLHLVVATDSNGTAALHVITGSDDNTVRVFRVDPMLLEQTLS